MVIPPFIYYNNNKSYITAATAIPIRITIILLLKYQNKNYDIIKYQYLITTRVINSSIIIIIDGTVYKNANFTAFTAIHSP